MKWAVTGAVLFIAAAALAIVQMWFLILDGETFLKVEATLVIVMIAQGTLWFILREARDYRRQTRSSALDGEEK